MKPLRKAPPGRTLKVKSETWNEVVNRLTALENLVVRDATAPSGVPPKSELKLAPGGSVLRIEHNAQTPSELVGFSELSITFCDDDDEEVTKIFLVKDP